MKQRFFALLICLPLALGCGVKSTTPAAALAPGYSSTADQTLGQSLLAVTAFRDQEKVNFASLNPSQQTLERPYLNALIDAVNLANTTYLAFHNGTATLAQSQVNAQLAQNAQTNLTSAKGATK